ncbi:MAG: hypothetical protein IKW49_03215 [Opitutales bacterium]|nr:hypothetical protein [Opitutales bacterium]
MKSKILPIVISNLLVAGIVWYVAAAPAADTDALAAKDAEIRALKDELARKNTRSARGNRASSQRAERPAVANDEAANDETREARRQQMAQRFDNFRRIRTNTAISRLALRLNLSAEQTTRMHELAQARSAEAQNLMVAIREARENGADTNELSAQLREAMRANNPEEYITELLSDEQKAEYEAYRAERATARAETVANMRLSMLQESVALNQEQKDKYFSEYASAAMNNDGRVDRDTEERILRGVLSAEQWNVYAEQQKAMEALGGPGGPGGPGGMRGGRGMMMPPM